MTNKNNLPTPPKQPTILDGYSRKSNSFEQSQFEFEQEITELLDPSDRYGRYEDDDQ